MVSGELCVKMFQTFLILCYLKGQKTLFYFSLTV